MIIDSGSNIQNVKLQNRILVLKYIAASDGITRLDLSRLTGLSKMTVGNIVAELLCTGLVKEDSTVQETGSSGRKPQLFRLSDRSVCICGMLIKRKFCQIILTDLGGHIFFQKDCPYVTLRSNQHLVDMMKTLYQSCAAFTSRRIIAIGVACVGPLDSSTGYILKPPFFSGIENLPIVEEIQAFSGLPTFLVNDATAGALSEKMFGLGASIDNFAYLHIMNGIGMGMVLNNTLYDGDSGQSGEIGHTSINFNGPVCSCGNRGCLDIYASMDAMRSRIRDLAPFYTGSPLTTYSSPDWAQIVTAGNERDPLALVVLEEFCAYIAYSLTNTINLLNLSTIIVGYDSNDDGLIVEELIEHKLNTLAISSNYHPVKVLHSSFGGNAPLIGSAALVANRVFSQLMPLQELEEIV